MLLLPTCANCKNAYYSDAYTFTLKCRATDNSCNCSIGFAYWCKEWEPKYSRHEEAIKIHEVLKGDEVIYV